MRQGQVHAKIRYMLRSGKLKLRHTPRPGTGKRLGTYLGQKHAKVRFMPRWVHAKVRYTPSLVTS